MEKYKSEKVSFWRKPFRRLAALALAAALALGLAACDGASVLGADAQFVGLFGDLPFHLRVKVILSRGIQRGADR